MRRSREAAVWTPKRLGIKLTPDKSRAYLVAETEMETPLSLAAGGVSEKVVAGARFVTFREESSSVKFQPGGNDSLTSAQLVVGLPTIH
jgi:hypothetical protein